MQGAAIKIIIITLIFVPLTAPLFFYSLILKPCNNCSCFVSIKIMTLDKNKNVLGFRQRLHPLKTLIFKKDEIRGPKPR